MKTSILTIAILCSALFLITSSCSKDPAPDPVTIIEKTDSVKVNFSSSGTFTFFSFKNNAIVANSDSASTKWDFGLRFTTFILNSNAYGPGNAGAILQNNIYNKQLIYVS